MILNSIELENIRSYEKERIDFPKGITLFEGDIGSGKSSVLMGIEFALFGLGSQRPESLLSKKASEGSVILEFEVDEKRYIVKRKLKRKNDSVSQDAKDSYLIYDGQTEPLSPSELKQKILQILKFNEPSDPRSESRIFRYAVFTPQEEMKQILRDTGKRLETIRKAFGIEDYRIVTDNAKNLSGKLKEKMVEFAVRFEKLNEDEQSLSISKKNASALESQLERLVLDKCFLEERKSSITKAIDLIKEQMMQKEKFDVQLDKLNDQIKNVTTNLSIFDSQIISSKKTISEIESELESLAKIRSPTTRSITEIDVEINNLSQIRDKILDAKSKMTSLESDLAALQKSLGEFVNLSKIETDKIRIELGDIRNKLESIKAECTVVEKQKILLEKECKDIELLLLELKNLGAKCPHCEHELTQEHKKKVENERRVRLQSLQDNLRQIEDDSLRISETLKYLIQEESAKDQKLRQIERTLPLREQWFEKTNLLTSIKAEISHLESQFALSKEESFSPLPNEDALSYLRRLKDAKREFEASRQRISTLQSQRKKEEQLLNDAQIKSKEQHTLILNIKKEIECILNDLNRLSGLEQTYIDKAKEQADIERQLETTKSDLIRYTQLLENENTKITNLEQRILEAKHWRAQHLRFSNYYTWLREFFIPTIDKIEKQVLLSIQQNFNEIYKKWYSVLIDDVTKESKINEEFTPLVEQDGFTQDVEFLSGGEKTSIALAYRLALNSMMRRESDGLKSNLLILDEPTDGFSKAQLSKVRNLLSELKSQQIILVSHEKELEAYVDNIFQITKDSGISRVLRVST